MTWTNGANAGPRWGITPVVPALVGASFLAGCLGDPPPDPSTAPLEVVLEGCVLNRPEVAPGTHELSLINAAENQRGELVVSGADGVKVLTMAVGDAAQLVTTDQRYAFTCQVGQDTSTATLESTP